MDIDTLVNTVFKEILKEIRMNSNFRERIIESVKKQIEIANKNPIRTHRRKPGPFDPMTIYNQQPDLLEHRLQELTVDELKDIIAEHGMDRTKLAMKWKNKERLVALIVTTVHSRSQKGDAFRIKTST